MDTVVDIEPASFAVTPGRAETVTLTVHNHGEDVEAYHLSAAGEAADQIVIEPETLLLHPGKSGTAVATIALPAEARWPVGHLLLRFEIAPAVHPDDLVAVEAIASVRPFSEVDAALSSPDLDGRRGDTTGILIANSGNAHVYAGLAVAAGELAVAVERSRVTIPAGSTESVELGLRVRRLLWRGDPVEHPFAVTVAPETAPAVRLEGTFTQLPVFSPRGFTAALAVAGALIVLVVVWLAALAWNVFSPVGASPSQTTAAETSEPVNVAVALAAGDLGQAGDAAVATLSAEVANAPDGALVAIAVQWPAELALSDSTCERWVGPEIDRELQGPPRSGDECLIDPSGSDGSAQLTFATPPPGFNGQVDATATRLLTLEDGEVQELETADGSSFGQAGLPIELRPYPFWLDLAITEPSDADQGERQATIGVHRTLSGDGSDESARMAFELLLPGFAELDFFDGCDALGDNDATCVVYFGADLDYWEVTATFETDVDPPRAGPVSVQGVELSVDDVEVPPAQIGPQIRGAEQLLIAVDDLFPVDVELDSEEAEAGETVTANVEITHTPLPSDVQTLRTGSWALAVELTWPESLILNGGPRGCISFDRGICGLPGPAEGGRAVITLQFTVADDAFDSGDVAANGARLLYDPTTEADERDDREQPPVELPAEWIGSDTAEFFPF
ncbi:hypothetical protein [Agromyces sp. NPDC049794]|uniref:COG1470 family protein n=1 Tax=unclassified Agromyces TaxID=2639701 RepID=UPI0033FDB40D